jgi:hypothetical protein
MLTAAGPRSETSGEIAAIPSARVPPVHQLFGWGSRLVTSGTWRGRRVGLCRRLELQLVQVRVEPIEFEQLLVRAVFGHHAVVDDDDLIGVAQRA